MTGRYVYVHGKFATLHLIDQRNGDFLCGHYCHAQHIVESDEPITDARVCKASRGIGLERWKAREAEAQRTRQERRAEARRSQVDRDDREPA